MNTELFEQMAEQAKVALGPVHKFNQLAVANVEKLAALQLASLQDYSDLSIAQLKAALEISDVESLQDYVKKQAELASAVREKLVADAKAVTELGGEFSSEAKKLAEESFKAVSVKAA